MTKPIVKREYVQDFAQGYGTTMVNEQRLAKDLERAYTMIEALRAECKTVVDDNGKGHEDYAPNDVAALIEESHYNALTRILDGE